MESYNLARESHNALKTLGGFVLDGVVLREPQIEKELISEKDKRIIYKEIDLISDKLYKIEKILSKYEA